MDKLATKNVGGFPLILDDLRQFFGRLDAPSEGIYQAFNNLLRGFGDNFIVQGVVASGTTPNVEITEGWVILDGELIKVDAQTGINTTTNNKFVKETTFNSRGTKTFLNGSIAETYEINRAVVQGTSGNLDFDGDTLNDIIGLSEWKDFIFNGNDFVVDTQGGGNNWDVTLPSDITTAQFRKRGKTVDISIFIDGFGISIATSAALLIIKNFPFTSKNISVGFAAFTDIDTDTSFTGKCNMLDGSDELTISLTEGTGFAPPFTATTNMRVQLSITLEIE